MSSSTWGARIDRPDVHDDVIRSLREGTTHALDLLRQAAALARDALLRGDLEAFGAALAANTEAA